MIHAVIVPAKIFMILLAVHSQPEESTCIVDTAVPRKSRQQQELRAQKIKGKIKRCLLEKYPDFLFLKSTPGVERRKTGI